MYKSSNNNRDRKVKNYMIVKSIHIHMHIHCLYSLLK